MADTINPRICEILDVKPGERFTVAGDCLGKTYFVTSVGQVVTESGEKASSDVLCAIINNPSIIFRRPAFTEDELSICKSLGAKYVSVDNNRCAPFVRLWTDEPVYHLNIYCPGVNAQQIAQVDKKKFPSLDCGDCVKVQTEQ